MKDGSGLSLNNSECHQQQTAKNVRLNKSRMDFADKFQKLIDDYNVACLAGIPT